MKRVDVKSKVKLSPFTSQLSRQSSLHCTAQDPNAVRQAGKCGAGASKVGARATEDMS